jgi:hypothetical protein
MMLIVDKGNGKVVVDNGAGPIELTLDEADDLFNPHGCRPEDCSAMTCHGCIFEEGE